MPFIHSFKVKAVAGLAPRFYRGLGLTLATIASICAATAPANAQVAPINTTPIFSDDFNGSQLDPAAWALHNEYFGLQRTQYGNKPKIGKDSDGTTFLSIPLSTYNHNYGKTGVQFLGTEIMSRAKWTLGSGIEFEARMRSNQLPSGLVLGIFPYGDYGDWTSTYQKSEIDWEFIAKQPKNNIWLNIWDDWNPERGGPNSGIMGNIAEFDWNNGSWNNYKIRWYPDRTEWIVNDNIVARTEKTVRPGAPMGLWMNNWAAASSWTTAYDAALQPTADPALNQTYSYDVDYVKVRPIPATKGVWGTGTGLTGRYYDVNNFTGKMVLRKDHRINFDWGAFAPDPSLGVDTFSARWTGTVQAQYTENYTFTVRSDDGVRLWINNQQVINNWVNQSATEKSATVKLTAGTKYAIKLEYYDNTGGAVCQLFWSSPSTPRQVIPQSQLYPDSVVALPVFTPPGGSYAGSQNIKIASATAGTTIRYTLDGSDPNELCPILAAGQTIRVTNSQLIRAKAYVSGQVPSEIASAYYTIAADTTQPTAAVTTPTESAFFSSIPTVKGTASDSATGSGVQRVDVQITRLRDGLRWNGSTWISTDYGLQTVLTAKPLANDPTNVEWVCNGPYPTGANATAGAYEIKAFTYDLAGNINNMNVAPAKVEFNLDTLAPSAAISTPAAGATIADLTGVTGTAADEAAGSGINRVNLVIVRQSDNKQWNGWVWQTTPTGIPVALTGTNWTVVATASNGAKLPSGSNLPNGSYLLRAVAYDKVGNASVAERSVTKGTVSLNKASSVTKS